MKTGLAKVALLIQCSLLPFGNTLSVSSHSADAFEGKTLHAAGVPANKPPAAPCPEIDWATWTSFTGKSATGTITNQGKDINVTVSSNFEFGSTPEMERYESFKRFKAPIPNRTIPRTSWSKEPGGTTTICFSQSVKEPILLLASLGSYKGRILVTVNFSEPYVMMLNVGGMIAESNTSLTGREGYAIIKFPGDIRCITIQSSAFESFTDLTLGIPVCPEGIPKPNVKKPEAPKPEPKPVEASKPAPVMAADKPAPKSVEAPKPAPVAEAPKPVEVVKPAPIVSAPKPEPKPIEVEKPSPVVLEVPKAATIGAAAPKPVLAVEVQKPAPVVAVAKPEPKPEPKPVEVPKPTPVVKAAKPEPKPVEAPNIAPVVAASVPVEAPKPTPIVAIPKPAPKPVEALKPAPAVASPKPIASVTPVRNQAPSVKAAPLNDINILRVRVWDYDGMDRDSISLKLNGQPVGPAAIQLPLYKLYKADEFTYTLNLQPGNNKLEMYVISEGIKPLATVALSLMYEEGQKRLYFELKEKQTIVIDL